LGKAGAGAAEGAEGRAGTPGSFNRCADTGNAPTATKSTDAMRPVVTFIFQI
jgi:hypothetical protein